MTLLADLGALALAYVLVIWIPDRCSLRLEKLVIDDPINLLEAAGDMVQTAADILADLDADAYADAGGVGRPPKNPTIALVYRCAELLSTALSELYYRNDEE